MLVSISVSVHTVVLYLRYITHICLPGQFSSALAEGLQNVAISGECHEQQWLIHNHQSITM